MADPQDRKPEDANEGEGNRTAARRYNKATEKFAHGGKVDEAARAAEAALGSDEGDELREAEAEGKSHAKGKDV